MKADLASIYHAEGKIDSALELVRGLPDIVDPSCLNYTLAVASEIYLAVGITDTAYMYASELVGSEAADNHKTGYKVLLSPEIRGMLTPDTLALYAARCKDLSDEYLDAHDAQSMISQLSDHGHGIPALDQYNRRGGGHTRPLPLRQHSCSPSFLRSHSFMRANAKRAACSPPGNILT